MRSDAALLGAPRCSRTELTRDRRLRARDRARPAWQRPGRGRPACRPTTPRLSRNPPPKQSHAQGGSTPNTHRDTGKGRSKQRSKKGASERVKKGGGKTVGGKATCPPPAFPEQHAWGAGGFTSSTAAASSSTGRSMPATLSSSCGPVKSLAWHRPPAGPSGSPAFPDRRSRIPADSRAKG